MENLRFPNGIQLLPDEESVLVAETTMARIRRWLLHLFTFPSSAGSLKLQHSSLVWSLGDSGPSTFCLQSNHDATSLKNMSEILACVTMETSHHTFIRLMALHVCACALWLCGLVVEVKKHTLIRSIIIKKWIFTTERNTRDPSDLCSTSWLTTVPFLCNQCPDIAPPLSDCSHESADISGWSCPSLSLFYSDPSLSGSTLQAWTKVGWKHLSTIYPGSPIIFGPARAEVTGWPCLPWGPTQASPCWTSCPRDPGSKNSSSR